MKRTAELCVIASLTATLITACGSAPKVVASNPDQACKSVATRLNLKDTTVDAADFVAAGFTPPGSSTSINLPFCRVRLTSKPSIDSDIKSELWMPAFPAWNGRFLAVGGNNNSGAIMYDAMQKGLAAGYATLSTDNGHSTGRGTDQSWAVGRPEKVIDFGHRAQAVTAVAGKAGTQAFYDQSAKKSYWLGCSQGGGKGMMQSQRYPENFDGIVASGPVFDWVGSQFAAPWVSVKGMRDPAALVPRSKLPAIHKAVLAACDAVDGVADGLIQQPQRCNFNPAMMACPAGTDANTCLTPGQVESMNRYWSPVTRPNGVQIYAGFPLGSEANSMWLGATQPNVGSWSQFWPNVVYEDPTRYSLVASLNVDTDIHYDFAKNKLSAIYDAVSTDLDAFKGRGGKILIHHGLNDQFLSAYHTRDYVDGVFDRYGRDEASKFLQLYLVPGMNHCSGGEGPQPNDMAILEQMADWVEKGIAPTSIPATHTTAGVVDRTMPLCPYPQVARYKGAGDVKAAANWVCGAP